MTAYPETTSLDIGRNGVRVRVTGIPARTNPTGGEAMIPGALAEEIGDAIERILAVIEQHKDQEAEAIAAG